MQYVFGIDVGGTAIKSGLFTTEGTKVGMRHAPTGALVDEAAYRRVAAVLEEMLAEAGVAPQEVVGIGLDTPGAVLADGTHVMHHNIEIEIAELSAFLQQCYPAATLSVLNDGNAAALGELWQGSAQGVSDFVLVVLGTGVGAGVVIDGQVVAGAHGAGGECGHICVNPLEQRRCTCGRRGCAEQTASATWIVRNYEEACARLGRAACDTSRGAIAVFDAFGAGDEAAAEALEIMCDGLGHMLAAVACVVDPEVFVLGGGVSAGFDMFSEGLTQAYQHYAIENTFSTPIIAASLGNEAGMYGAAFAALRASSRW